MQHYWVARLTAGGLLVNNKCCPPPHGCAVFRIIEASAGGLSNLGLFGSRSRTHTLKAVSVEECMEWCLGIREVLASMSSR